MPFSGCIILFSCEYLKILRTMYIFLHTIGVTLSDPHVNSLMGTFSFCLLLPFNSFALELIILMNKIRMMREIRQHACVFWKRSK